MRTNWAGNLRYSTDRLHLPASIEEAQDIVRKAEKVRPLGSAHCFNPIADSTVQQISAEALDFGIELDADAQVVTVSGGVRYGELAPFLHEHGYAIHNLASLPHISIVGACATATHGSGVQNGNLATAVRAIEFIDASGELVRLSRDADGDRFAGAVVNLGCLGLVTRISLHIEPTFDMTQHVYLNQPMADMVEHADALLASGYSVSLFTDYKNQANNQIWVKRKATNTAPVDATFYNGILADRNVNPVPRMSPENCTTQLGVAGPWHERLPHFKMAFTPSSGKELQTEFFVAREHTRAVLDVYRAMADDLAPILMISEIRTAAADDLWMSMAYNRESVIFHCTWEQNWDVLQALLPRLEAALKPFDARPHWGKNFRMGREELTALYPRFDDFRDLVATYDPAGKFRNAFMEEKLFGG
ncbi:MAG: D-arabinono-1,4-lactone oxidase [Bacteroidota bacterium]